MTAKKGLGKGLGAMLGSTKPDLETVLENSDGNILEIDINNIEPNRQQPRKRFDSAKLDELAASVQAFGIIQPIIVKKEENYYSIIAGERRWRAARLAGLSKVPVIIKDYAEIETYEVALIENIQRADLNPVEEALCFKKLIEEYSLSQDVLAKRVGKNRSYISNCLRILAVGQTIQEMLIDGRLTMGHVRTLLPIEDESVRIEMAEKIAGNNLNVRDTEKLVGNHLKNKTENPVKTPIVKSLAVKSAESVLSSMLCTKVNIKDNFGKGKIEIEYYSEEDLDRILVGFRNLNE